MNTHNQNESTEQPGHTPTADDLSVMSVLLQNIKGISAVSSTSASFDFADETDQ